MTVTIMWLRLEWRRRWRSLTVLALLVAFATATVLASVAGARRGDTAIDRLAAGTLPATIAVLPNQPGFDWTKVAALPEVAALTKFPVSGFGIDGIPGAWNSSAFPPADTAMLSTIERAVVLQGRLPDPARSDEVVVSSRFPASYHRSVGDHLTLRLMSVAQANDENFDPATQPMAGPAIPARIVGVIRSPWLSEQIGDKGGVLPSAALYAAHPGNFIGKSGYINALIRLKGGEAAIPAFRAGLARVSGRGDIDVWNLQTKFTGPARQVTGFEAVSLLAFGLAALAAAIVLVGQSVARYTAATTTDLDALRAVGMSPRQSTAAAAAGPFLAAVAGTILGVAGAAVVSLWMPIGLAALKEPTPGFDLDWLVLGTGAALVPVLVLAAAVAAAALNRVSTQAGAGQAGRRSAVALAASRAGLPVPVVLGARFALEPGRGRSAVPVRPALLGAVAGVLGVLAAFTFSAGVHDAAAHPARFGQTHQLEAFTGINGQDFMPVDKVLAQVSRDPAVQSVIDDRCAVAESGKVSVTTFSYAPVGGTTFPVVQVAGRMPSAAGEIMLAPGSARALGAQVGDRVSLGGGGTPAPMTVTGLGFVPVGPHNTYNEGGWVTPAGYDLLFHGAHYPYKFRSALIVLRPGADAAATAKRLTQAAATIDGGQAFSAAPPQPLPELRQIRDVQQLPVLLAGFLALLAVGAVGHALATAVRRRRHEVAVLRALGMTRRQSRWTVVTQATLLALVGLGFGVPLGVALGRVLWRITADSTPLAYLAPLAVWALVLAVPLTLLLANLLAAWPGRIAARLRIGHLLRAE